MNSVHFWLISTIVVFLTFLFKGLVGFGASLVLLPFFSIFLDIKTAVIVTSLADVSSSFVFMITKRKNIRWSIVKNICIGLFVGTVIGVVIFGRTDGIFLKRIFGVFLISYIILPIVFKNFILKGDDKKLLGTLAGFTGGICGGVFNINGPPVVLYVSKTLKNKLTIRSSLLAIFFIDSLWRVSLYGIWGYYTFDIVKFFIIVMIPALLLGLFFADKIDSKLRSKFYFKIVKLLLFLSGLNMLFR